MTSTFDASLVLGLAADSRLGAFNRSGLLAPADVHVATRLGRLAGDDDELVALAAAFAVRAPRVGHVRVDLARVRQIAGTEVDDDVALDDLPWPEPEEWLARVAASPLVASGDEESPETRAAAPLRLVGSALYLDRYWRDERAVARDLLGRLSTDGPGPGPGVDRWLGPALSRLFAGDGDGDTEQRWAVAVAVLHGLAVIAGGPGTGKTTTVARLIGVLVDEAMAGGAEPPLIALAAPTGKAANRMQEAVRQAADGLDLSDGARQHLAGLEASTVHRLLRLRPDNASRFRYHRRNRLPHDVVVVDETSMLSLWLMARLVEAVRGDARLVFVGDPEQLASVEAGAVLGDIVGPASHGLRMHAASIERVQTATGLALPVAPLAPGEAGIGDAIVVLRTNHRFGGALAALAEAVRSGDADQAVDALRQGGDAEEGDLVWLPVDPAEAGPDALAGVRRLASDAGARVMGAAAAGDAAGALEALSSWRILCAHRRGPDGVSSWNALVEQWLTEELGGHRVDGEWYMGRPVIVTANDYSVRLFNGDTGVVVAREGGGVEVAFEQGPVSPSRLSGLETVYAMTVHKAQGSEFDAVAVVLPAADSRILTRELLYTAVTRARRRLVLAGTEESVRAAVERPIARASGLTQRLWGTGG